MRADPATEGDLLFQARDLTAWLFGDALPLWWQTGADHGGWGYHESLSLQGRPTGADRRCRVQSRQAYAFATAARLGWGQAGMQAVNRGIDALRTRYRRSDGLFRTLVTASGLVVDDTAKLYDHAFILLALAAAHRLEPVWQDEALRLFDRIESWARHPAGGFRESGDFPFLANPHMHLLEAALAWIEAGGSRRWHELAQELVAFATGRLIGGRGCIHETYTADWHPLTGCDGSGLEPGHQFEWSWLLSRWAARAGDAAAASAAGTLFAVGCRGLIRDGCIVADRIGEDFVVSDSARLWPQTERLKAALALAAQGPDRSAAASCLDHAVLACSAIRQYCTLDARGLWHDRLQAAGGFVDGPAPASTLYHLVSAIEQLALSFPHLAQSPPETALAAAG